MELGEKKLFANCLKDIRNIVIAILVQRILIIRFAFLAGIFIILTRKAEFTIVISEDNIRTLDLIALFLHYLVFFIIKDIIRFLHSNLYYTDDYRRSLCSIINRDSKSILSCSKF
jgi:hypothetical protein